MKLCDAISRYIGYKQAIGMVFETEATILRAFTEKVGAKMPVAKITSESVLQYLNGRGPVTLFWHRKHDALSGLWRFAIQHGWTDRSTMSTGSAFDPFQAHLLAHRVRNSFFRSFMCVGFNHSKHLKPHPLKACAHRMVWKAPVASILVTRRHQPTDYRTTVPREYSLT